MTYSSSSFLMRRLLAAAALTASGLAAAAACSPSGNDSNSAIGNVGAVGDGATGGSAATGTGSGGTIPVGSGGTINPGSGGSIEVPDAGNGMCIRIGMLGRPPTYGAMPGSDNTDALQTWLDAHVKSGTTVSVVTTDTELTADFLSNYDVVVLQALEQQEGGPYWNLSPAELATFEAWVRAGGGVISMTGYGAQAQEVNPTNQLLAFTGMSYNMDDVFTTCPDNCCYCAGSSYAVHGWNPAHPIAANISAVGAFHGRTVAAADGTVVASEGAAVYGATKEIEAGRVFMYFDEWVAYSSQWSDSGTASVLAMHPECADPNNVCNGRSPGTAYQVPQFWYNALKWASGNAGCFDFTSDVPIVR